MLTHAAVGTMAPEFKLQDQDEHWISLSELLSRGPTLLAFYPGDFTPVCTKQLCSYQEALDHFVKYGVQVVGISGNPPDVHQKFKARYQFAFPLLSDPKKSVTKAYGVTSLLMFGGTSRAVVIVGKNGKIIYRYVEPTPLSHRRPGELLEILDQLREKGAL